MNCLSAYIDESLEALNAADGRPEWRFDTCGQVDTTSAVVVDGTVYVPRADGAVYALTEQ